MKIVLTKTENYNTELYNYLCSLPDSDIYSSLHNPPMKHPADILNSQLSNIKHNIMQLKISGINIKENDNLIKNLFQNVDAFYDNCFNIIKALYPPSNKQTIFPDKWLLENNIDTGRKFYQYTNQHHEFIRNITNIIKHGDPKIFSMKFEDIISKKTIEGFYFTSIIKNDLLGPDPRIHKHYNNQRTAFSLNFIIRKIIGHVFFYETYLFKAINVKNKDYFKQNLIYTELFEIGHNTKNDIFINEYDFPSSKFIKENDILSVEFPKTFANEKPKKYCYDMTTTIEMNNRTNKISGYLPYFGNRIE
jgi:hypothetical protein